jgi:hypothetical protein
MSTATTEIKRRHRYSNEKRGPEPVVTESSVAAEVLKILDRRQYVDSRTLYLLLPDELRCDETYFKKLLRRLKDWDYIERTWEDKQHDEDYLHSRFRRFGLHEHYNLGERGIEWLEEHYLRDLDLNPLVAQGRMGRYKDLPHALMVSFVLSSFELGARNLPNVRFMEWKEILARAPEKTRNAPNPFALLSLR